MTRKGVTAKQAAVSLVTASYRGEEEEYQSENGPWMVWTPGLLSREDLDSLASAIWPAAEQQHNDDSPDDSRVQFRSPDSERQALTATVLDELTLTEGVLRREGQRAFSELALSIGGAFFQAADAVAACAEALTECRTEEKTDNMDNLRAQARRAIDSLTRLEEFLPKSPGRFESLWEALALVAPAPTACRSSDPNHS
jgi:hypothetical protein